MNVYVVETIKHDLVVFHSQEDAKEFVQREASRHNYAVVTFEQHDNGEDLSIFIGKTPNRQRHYGWINTEPLNYELPTISLHFK